MVFIWDFPFGFWPTTSVGLFGDFFDSLPAPKGLQVIFPVRLPFIFGTAGVPMPFRAPNTPFLPGLKTSPP
jgi:hypothetical protein